MWTCEEWTHATLHHFLSKQQTLNVLKNVVQSRIRFLLRCSHGVRCLHFCCPLESSTTCSCSSRICNKFGPLHVVEQRHRVVYMLTRRQPVVAQDVQRKWHSYYLGSLVKLAVSPLEKRTDAVSPSLEMELQLALLWLVARAISAFWLVGLLLQNSSRKWLQSCSCFIITR